ncbi:DNA polymerase IV [Bacteroidia bacterium]|nr:DNA polymerase IV [Bacteroidota bacterium]MDA8930671.1 DNA polymerase IV [Bacteroidia bacterium]MDA9110763.1 DNA polymerase IV [Bacteroidia bacterium]
MTKNIVHMDLDTFYVSVERLIDSRLVGKPVLLGGVGDRGVVASCSYEARTFGVHSGMSMKMARQLCPQGIVIKGNSGTYSKYSKTVTEIIRETAPVVEKSSIDEFYLDLTGMDKFFGCYKLASELRTRITKETGLPISFGMSVNKTVSKVATGEAKPDNQLKIDFGDEKPFLAPLSVKKIPMIGKKTAFMLNRMGVQKIHTLQEMPIELLEKAFGKNGKMMWQKANGIDHSPLIPYHEKKSISTERTFMKDTIDIRKLKDMVAAMVEQLAYELRHGKRVCSNVSIKLRYSDFQTVSKQKRIPYTAADHTLIQHAKELFDSLYSRRVRIRLVGVRLGDLAGGGHQIDLFNDDDRIINLYQAMDAMKDRYGANAVRRGVAVEVKGLGRGNPFNGEPNVVPAHRNA